MPAETPPPAPGRRQHPLLIALLLLVIAVAVGVSIWQSLPEPKNPPPPTRGYYTVDDGKTWFVDDAERLPPFDHEGKPAVRLLAFSCDGGKTHFAGYLQKLPEEALAKAMKEAVAAGQNPKQIDDDDIAAEAGWLVKRPGDAEWVNSRSDQAKYMTVIKVTCPDGGIPEQIFPPEPK